MIYRGKRGKCKKNTGKVREFRQRKKVGTLLVGSHGKICDRQFGTLPFRCFCPNMSKKLAWRLEVFQNDQKGPRICPDMSYGQI